MVVALVARPLRLPLARAVAASALVNVVTQPTLYFALTRLPSAGGDGWWLALALAETLVVIVEAAFYRAVVTRVAARAFVISLAANAASALLGLALPF